MFRLIVLLPSINLAQWCSFAIIITISLHSTSFFSILNVLHMDGIFISVMAASFHWEPVVSKLESLEMFSKHRPELMIMWKSISQSLLLMSDLMVLDGYEVYVLKNWCDPESHSCFLPNLFVAFCLVNIMLLKRKLSKKVLKCWLLIYLMHKWMAKRKMDRRRNQWTLILKLLHLRWKIVVWSEVATPTTHEAMQPPPTDKNYKELCEKQVQSV